MSSLLSINEATSVLKISRSTLYRIIKRGEIKVLKIGRRTLIEQEQLLGLLRSTTSDRKFKVVSLYSGAGGMDLGFLGGFSFLGKDYERNNFEIVYAGDINQKAVDTYNRNLGNDSICEDVTKLDPKSIPDCDVVLGGFPCQDFSIAGKRRGLDSERGNLYKAMVRIVEMKQPMIFVAENVTGLLTANEGTAMERVHLDFSKAGMGYDVVYKVLNAADFGVPQKRERVIIIGVRKDIQYRCDFPDPTHMPEELSKEYGLEPWITAKQAIGDLEDDTKRESLANPGFSRAKKNKGQGNNRIRVDAPSPTIRSEHHGNIEYHYSLDRRLSAREAARLQSFPDDFVFTASTSDAYKLIGNAVPPVLAHRIAKKVQEFLTLVSQGH